MNLGSILPTSDFFLLSFVCVNVKLYLCDMRTDKIDIYKTIRSMVRGFFEGLFSALIEKADKENGKSRSEIVKN